MDIDGVLCQKQSQTRSRVNYMKMTSLNNFMLTKKWGRGNSLLHKIQDGTSTLFNCLAYGYKQSVYTKISHSCCPILSIFLKKMKQNVLQHFSSEIFVSILQWSKKLILYSFPLYILSTKVMKVLLHVSLLEVCYILLLRTWMLAWSSLHVFSTHF